MSSQVLEEVLTALGKEVAFEVVFRGAVPHGQDVRGRYLQTMGWALYHKSWSQRTVHGVVNVDLYYRIHTSPGP